PVGLLDLVPDGLADRLADPAALHGRHRRPALPRVRADALGGDPRVGGRLVDVDADAVREALEAGGRPQARRLRAHGRAAVRQPGGLLRSNAALGAPPPT